MTNLIPYEPPQYPLGAFLPLVRNATYELLRNIQAPDGLIGMCCIAGMAFSVQGVADVLLPTGQIRPASLSVLSIAESGERKTTLDSYVFAALYDRDALAATRHATLYEQYRVAMLQWESRQKSFARRLDRATHLGEGADAVLLEMADHARAKPKKPRLRRFMRQNITPRAIMDALEGDGESIAITTDEGEVMFRSGAMAQLGLLNKAWDGARMMTLDRADMDHVLVMNPRVTINIMTQRKVLLSYLEKHGDIARGSGHWARYLVGWPTSTQGSRSVSNGEMVWEHLPAFQERMKALLDQYDAMVASGEVRRERLEFSEDAKGRWFDLARTTEWMLRPGDFLNDINDFASKVMEILGRLAAVFHYFNGEQGKISLDTLERAVTVMNWHIEEYKRLFSPDFVMPKDRVDANKIVSYLHRCVWRGPGSNSWIAKNDLLQLTGVRSRDRLNAALQILKNDGAVWVGPWTNGRKRFVTLNSAFFARL